MHCICIKYCIALALFWQIKFNQTSDSAEKRMITYMASLLLGKHHMQSSYSLNTRESINMSKKYQTLGKLLSALSLALFQFAAVANAQTGTGGTASPVQSTVHPFGLNIAAPVMLAGSDAQSLNFQQNVLPSVTSLINTRLSEYHRVNDSAMLLDPSRLQLQTASDVRVYFVGEGAGYNNTLGYNTAGSGVASGNPLLIFPNASSSVSTYNPSSTAQRTGSAPLLPGDFVNLGQMAGGTMLNFFLIANGASGGRTVFSTDQSVNPDGINHVVSFAYAVPGSSFLIIAFEDLLGGGDRDFNDVIMAVDIGARNIAALTGTPEPTMCLSLGSLALGAVWLKRRRDLESRRVALQRIA